MIGSDEYQSFRSSVPQRKIIVDDDGQNAWTIYDAGPKSIRCPTMFLPPASGKADVFYKQILALSSMGYRCIAVEYPVYWKLRHWCEGFRKLLDNLNLDKVHIFGSSLGGFLGQKFAEYTYQSSRVHSIILCNSFLDTNIFQRSTSAKLFWTLPALALRKMVMGSFDRSMVDKEIAESIDFMVESLDNIGQQELASRLQMNCMKSYVEPQKLNNVNVLIMDVNDVSALSQAVKEEMYKSYPNARRAHLKDGGNFPYLSRSAEVNIYIQVHLRQYEDTPYSACEPMKETNLSSATGANNNHELTAVTNAS